MNHPRLLSILRPTFACLLLLSAGCEKPEVAYYETAKEDHSESVLMKMQRPKDEGPAMMPPQSSSPLPTWTLPVTWREEAPGAMQLARFAVGEGAAPLEITVASFPGDVGGLLANVNRWRGQLGLDATDEAGLAGIVRQITAAGGENTFVEMTNNGQTILALIAKNKDETWFFKLMGDAAQTEAEKPNFMRFLESIRF